MPELRSVRELSSWSSNPEAETFPYEVVVEAYQRVGKHFVPEELLDALVEARLKASGVPGSPAAVRLLDRFLDVALDKRDGRYDYSTYLALDLLPMPGTGDLDGQTLVAAELSHDRLFASLIADVIRFELAVLDGHTRLLPRMRPDAPTLEKRLRLASRAILPVLERHALADPPAHPAAPADDPIMVARRIQGVIDADISIDDRRHLRLSMFPVWIAHDEYLFIRVLQAFETAFALLCVRLRTAIAAVIDGEPDAATRAIDAAAITLDQASRAFSLMATMQVESFLTFRTYTEGASAIQSRGYKVVESLCAQPEKSRLDSPAYLSVPEVRQRLMDGQANLDDAIAAAYRAGHLSPTWYAELVTTMRRFESTLLQWRQTHYRLAVRMLGDRVGTGYTEGTPYLKGIRNTPVFRTLEHIHTSEWMG